MLLVPQEGRCCSQILHSFLPSVAPVLLLPVPPALQAVPEHDKPCSNTFIYLIHGTYVCAGQAGDREAHVPGSLLGHSATSPSLHLEGARLAR